MTRTPAPRTTRRSLGLAFLSLVFAWELYALVGLAAPAVKRRPLPPVRNAWTGIAHAGAECRVCAFATNARNALGLANQHARRTGHEVVAEQLLTVTYNRAEP